MKHKFVFWDTHGILFIDYLEKDKTIESDYYMALLDRLSAEINKKRHHMQKKNVLFHQNNAPSHESMEAIVKFNELSLRIATSPTSGVLIDQVSSSKV